VAFVLLGLGVVYASQARADDNGSLAWSVTPYIWATDTKIDLSADGTPIGSGEISFGDLVDATDASFQVVAEAGREGGNWSAFIDVTYLDTSDDIRKNVEGIDIRVDTDSEQWFIDAAVAYWPMGEEGGLNVFGGVRYIDLDDEYDFSIGAPVNADFDLNSDRDFTDALVGVRYRFDLARHWSLLTRGDYSFGDSEGIWLLQAVARYAVGGNRQHGILLGYRYKEGELEDSGISEDYEWKGPLAGFNFRF
jgi:hypothetical protein